jgi:predicted RNA binding protein YcfA (HicA-like mRNA interferase family)
MRPIGSRELISALLKDGFRPRGKSGGGSHLVYKKTTPEGTRNVVVVLAKKEIPIGTLKSILRQAGLTEKQLFNLLD